MAQFSTSPAAELPSEHVEALNAVDLRLYFGNHGYHDAIPDYGTVETRLEDIDFAGMQPLITSFNAERGDVFAREALEYDKQWNLGEYLDLLSFTMRQSPYVTQSDREILSLPVLDPAYATQEVFLDTVEKMRAYQLINPIDYASVHASAKGVECLYADVSQQESNAWWTEAEEAAGAYPDIMLPYLRYKSAKAEAVFRDAQIISELGAIALAMPADKKEAPVLSYAVGRAHKAGIEQHLDNNNVTYSSNDFSPDRRARYRRDTLRDIANLVIPNIESSDSRYKKLWIANAAAVADKQNLSQRNYEE